MGDNNSFSHIRLCIFQPPFPSLVYGSTQNTIYTNTPTFYAHNTQLETCMRSLWWRRWMLMLRCWMLPTGTFKMQTLCACRCLRDWRIECLLVSPFASAPLWPYNSTIHVRLLWRSAFGARRCQVPSFSTYSMTWRMRAIWIARSLCRLSEGGHWRKCTYIYYIILYCIVFIFIAKETLNVALLTAQNIMLQIPFCTHTARR